MATPLVVGFMALAPLLLAGLVVLTANPSFCYGFPVSMNRLNDLRDPASSPVAGNRSAPVIYPGQYRVPWARALSKSGLNSSFICSSA
jgi:hypothetical protein